MHLSKHYTRTGAIFILFFCCCTQSFSQTFWDKSSIGLGVGGMQYTGDIPKPYTRIAFQGTYTYEITDHINVRGQVFFGSLGASDNPNIVNDAMGRPHPFDTRIQEASVLGEYNLLNMNQGKKWTPYGFIGIGLFHFVPYYTETDGKNYRWPTHSNKKMSIPLGAGIKYALTDNIRIFGEGNLRYTNTDEIDGYEPTAINPNYKRSKINDYFFSLTFGLSFKLGGLFGNGNNGGFRKSKYNTKNCPPVY
ncbi:MULTISPECIES: DUF6089 family protein [Chitinophagaceae]